MYAAARIAALRWRIHLVVGVGASRSARSRRRRMPARRFVWISLASPWHHIVGKERYGVAAIIPQASVARKTGPYPSAPRGHPATSLPLPQASEKLVPAPVTTGEGWVRAIEQL